MFSIGKTYFVQTPTHYFIGTLVPGAEDGWFMLENACWVADTGRVTQAFKNGTLDEVELYTNPLYIPLNAIIMITEWTHPVPTQQK